MCKYMTKKCVNTFAEFCVKEGKCGIEGLMLRAIGVIGIRLIWHELTDGTLCWCPFRPEWFHLSQLIDITRRIKALRVG